MCLLGSIHLTYASDNLQLDTEYLMQHTQQISLTDLHDIALFTTKSPYAHQQIYQDFKGDIFMHKKQTKLKPYHSLFQQKNQYLNENSHIFNFYAFHIYL